MTRYEDSALGKSKKEDMESRMAIVEKNKADILVSIHQNSYPSPSAKGAQVFYHKNSQEGKRLAQCIQKALSEKVDSQNKRMAKDNSAYYVLRKNSVPSVIVECGFLSNAQEESLLNSEEYRHKIAWAVYCGISEYFAG